MSVSDILVLISGPSLDPHENVSGVSKVVSEIIKTLGGEVLFAHLELGRKTSTIQSSRNSGAEQVIRALRLALSLRYSIYHSNTSLEPKAILRDFVFCSIARFRNKPVVLHLHGGRFYSQKPPPWLAFIIRFMLSLASVIVVLSEKEREVLQRIPGTASSKVKVLYNFSSIPKSAETSDETKYQSPLRITFCGRLVPEKGITELIAAAAQIPATTAMFHIYGDGVLRPDVEKAARTLSNVRYRGVYTAEEAPSIYSATDVVCLLSRFGEGMPMFLVEGMCAGCIPIATDDGSISEMFESGRTGFLVRAPVVSNVVDLIEHLYGDPTLKAQMRESVLNHAARCFSTEYAKRILLDFYAEALSAKGRSSRMGQPR